MARVGKVYHGVLPRATYDLYFIVVVSSTGYGVFKIIFIFWWLDTLDFVVTAFVDVNRRGRRLLFIRDFCVGGGKLKAVGGLGGGGEQGR